MHLNVDWSVSIDGKPYTDRFNPYVQEIEVTDTAGETGDSARITLADDGRLIMPRRGADIVIAILGETVFTGVTKTPRWSTAKGSGGAMVLTCSSHDTEGPGKEGRHFAKEDATLEEYVQEFAKRAGFTIKVDPALAKLHREWWGPEGRSFFHTMQQLARENGGTFKVAGKKAILAKRGQGMTPSGQSLPAITVTNPGNLLSADIEPYDASEIYRDVRIRSFNRKAARFDEDKVDAEAEGKAALMMRGVRHSRQDAKERGEGEKTDTDRDKGGGSVEIDIEPRARAEATCMLTGLRPGINGTYRIETATHTLRAGDGGGATTKLELKQPGEGTEKDGRRMGVEE